MVMRQYERQRSIRGDDFIYQDMKKVYTIVLVEKHSKEMKEIENKYLHRENGSILLVRINRNIFER